MNTDSIEKATNKSWQQWVKELDAMGGRTMTHKDIARKLYDQLAGTIENHGWWAQGITVAYEQHMGKRVPGQLVNGLFEIAVSKTLPINRTELFPKVVKWFENQSTLHNQAPLMPRSSETSKRSNWRCNFNDGSKFAATAEPSGDKTKLVLSHTAIPTKSQADAWKIYWKQTLVLIEAKVA